MSLRETLKTLFGTAWHVRGGNIIDSVTPAVDGTAEAGKPVVPNANGDVAGLRDVALRNLEMAGELDFAADALADPGDDATVIGADKVIKVTVGGTDYWIPVVDNNTST